MGCGHKCHRQEHVRPAGLLASWHSPAPTTCGSAHLQSAATWWVRKQRAKRGTAPQTPPPPPADQRCNLVLTISHSKHSYECMRRPATVSYTWSSWTCSLSPALVAQTNGHPNTQPNPPTPRTRLHALHGGALLARQRRQPHRGLVDQLLAGGRRLCQLAVAQLVEPGVRRGGHG